MADTIYYVDTDAAGGGDGSPGSPYDGLIAGLTAREGVIGAGDRVIFRCRGDALDPVNASYTFTNYTGDGELIIEGDRAAANGFNDGDAWSDAHYRLGLNVNQALRPASTTFTLDGVQCLVNVSGTFQTGISVFSFAGKKTNFVNNRFRLDAAATGSPWAIGQNANNQDFNDTYIINNTFEGFNSDTDAGGFGAWANCVGVFYAYNNTITDCGYGVYNNRATVTLELYNNAIFDNVDDLFFSNGTLNHDYNATDDADARGTNGQDLGGNQTAWDAAMVNPSLGEFRPKTTGVMYQNGLGNGTDPLVPLFDIVGDARSGTSPSIGAYEEEASGGQPAIVLDTGGELDGGGELFVTGPINLATGGELDGGGDLTTYLAVLPPPAGVLSPNVYVVNMTTGIPMYAALRDDITYDPYSVCKAMTAYILEREKGTVAGMAETVTITAADVAVGGVTGQAQAGDVIDYEGLMHQIMIPSSNSCANAISRTIGDELGGAGGTVRFVEEMNALAAAWGMTNTIFESADGWSGNNQMSAYDMALLIARVFADTQIWTIKAMRWYDYFTRVSAGPSAPGFTDPNFTPQIVGKAGLIATKAGQGGGVGNLATRWEAPNGDQIAIATMGAGSAAQGELDHAAIMTQALIDFPILATPTTPWTPDSLFDRTGARGAWFDFTDPSTMFSDVDGTVAAVINGPVARINSKRGSPGAHLLQATVLNQGTLRFSDGNYWLERKIETFYVVEPLEFTDP